MSNPLTAAQKAAAFAQETATVWPWCVKLSHSTWGAGQYKYWTTNWESFQLGGQTYLPQTMELDGPSEGSGSVPEMTLKLCNVDRSAVQMLRSITDPPIDAEVSIAFLPTSGAASVAWGPWPFVLRVSSWDMTEVECTLAMEYLRQTIVPAKRFTPDKYPNLFYPVVQAGDRGSEQQTILARRAWVRHVRELRKEGTQ